MIAGGPRTGSPAKMGKSAVYAVEIHMAAESSGFLRRKLVTCADAGIDFSQRMIKSKKEIDTIEILSHNYAGACIILCRYGIEHTETVPARTDLETHHR
jgi:hypothetical protein